MEILGIGHVGIVWAVNDYGSISTIETNAILGNCGEKGGPAGYFERSPEEVACYIRPDFFDIKVGVDSYKNVKISWDTVAGATKYAVWIEGDPVYKYYGEACSYDFSGWNNGTYNVFVGAYNTELIRVTPTIPITINNKIEKKGDINGDGKVNGKDWSRLYEHISETNELTGEELKRADVNDDGKVNGKDWNRLYEHITEVNPLN